MLQGTFQPLADSIGHLGGREKTLGHPKVGGQHLHQRLVVRDKAVRGPGEFRRLGPSDRKRAGARQQRRHGRITPRGITHKASQKKRPAQLDLAMCSCEKRMEISGFLEGAQGRNQQKRRKVRKLGLGFATCEIQVTWSEPVEMARILPRHENLRGARNVELATRGGRAGAIS